MTRAKPTPSKEYLETLLNYEPETGKLTWKPRPEGHFKNGGHTAAHTAARWNSKFAGKEAFTAKSGSGYRHSTIDGRMHTAHRIIWKLVHGVEAEQIDHVNGVRDDNRLCNLRSVSHAENLRNVARHKGRTNPGTGVRKTKNGKWQAYLSAGGRFVSLGSHECKEKALAIRKAAESAYGFHQNHGREAAS